MNNKGFTLIELLAVIVILLGISLIVLSSVTSSLKKTEKKEIENQEILAINAAKIYFSLNEVDNVEIGTLIEGNKYLDKEEVSKLGECDIVKISGDEYVYISGECSTE